MRGIRAFGRPGRRAHRPASTAKAAQQPKAAQQCAYLWVIQPSGPDSGVPCMAGISGDRRSAENAVFGLLRRSKARTALVFEVRYDSATWPGRYRPAGRQWLAVRNAETTAWMIELPM